MSKDKIKVTCKSCGHDDRWDGYEEMARVTGQAGNPVEVILVGGCSCGNQQKIQDL
jgi:hypothetical protein